MSLITRCPACGTMFKVVPDQLRVSDGWVRCGHCTKVFDATAAMQEDAEAEGTIAEAESAPSGSPEPALEAAPAPPDHEHPALDASTAPAITSGSPPAPLDATAAQAPVEEEPASGFFPSAIHTDLPEDAAGGVPDSEQLLEHAQLLREDALDQPFELRRADREDEPVDAPAVSEPAPLEREPELQDLSFVREARRKEFWGTPTVRAVLALLLVVLASLLVVQYAVHNRDRLAAADPGLRPWLSGLCEPFRCTIRPPRQIESIAIDNSSFNKLAGDTYRLSVSVKNQASTPSAVPALELTLTDAQDQPVIRRVLLPAELASATGVIAPGSDWSTVVALAVTANDDAIRIAGYRVIAFYP